MALNDLSPRAWTSFARSWFASDGLKAHYLKVGLHPTAMLEDIPMDFIRFFTRKGDLVLDPFAGSGGFLHAAQQVDRRSIGIEIDPDYGDLAQRSWYQGDLRLGDSRALLPSMERGSVDYVLTHPPYWLLSARGLVGSKPAVEGDIGRIPDYGDYLDSLVEILDLTHSCLRKDGYLTVFLQDINHERACIPVVADVISRMKRWKYKGKRIWCETDKDPVSYGYPSTYVVSHIHHEGLTFQRV